MWGLWSRDWLAPGYPVWKWQKGLFTNAGFLLPPWALSRACSSILPHPPTSFGSSSYICPRQKLLNKEFLSAAASTLPVRNKCLAFSDTVRVPTHPFYWWIRKSHFASLTRCYHHNTQLLIHPRSLLTGSLVENRGCLPFIFLIFIKQKERTKLTSALDTPLFFGLFLSQAIPGQSRVSASS